MQSKLRQVVSSSSVLIPVGSFKLNGYLVIPQEAIGIVLLSQGSGSTPNRLRNKTVAKKLNEIQLATLEVDLDTGYEELLDEESRAPRIDITTLTERLVSIIDWLIVNPSTMEMKIGIFSASSGAASAICAANRREKWVRAVVSHSGRPDLVKKFLPDLNVPTLLIVGGKDDTVLELNERAFDAINCAKKLSILVGASHFFSEPGTLDQVSLEAACWFHKYLR